MALQRRPGASVSQLDDSVRLKDFRVNGPAAIRGPSHISNLAPGAINLPHVSESGSLSSRVRWASVRGMRYWWVLIAALLVTGTASSGRANGRFPESLRLLEYRNNPDWLLLSATFGLLATHDRGKNWYYICEKAFAFEFIEGDPLLEVMPDGTLLSGIYQSLNSSRDCGCTWQFALGEPPPETVWDLTTDTSAPQRVLALLRDSTTLPFKSRVHESSDNGKTWRKLVDLAPNVIDVYTIDIAPSDSKRIYVSGISRPESGPDRGVLLVSKDSGATWEELAIPGTSQNVAPYIAAVHPTNPEAIFLRTDEWIDGVDPSANDALLYSADGGKSWREVFKKGGKLFGFAISPDASTVVIGLGDPLQAGGRSTEPEDLGVYKASMTDLVFQKIYAGMISCLRWTSTGLYVCHAENGGAKVPADDFELGFARNADFTLTTPNPLTVLLKLADVRGPPSCLTTACGASWQTGTEGGVAVCSQFKASCTIPPPNTNLTCHVDDGGIGGGDSSPGADARADSNGMTDAIGAGGGSGTTDAAGAGGSSATSGASGAAGRAGSGTSGSGGAGGGGTGTVSGTASCGCRAMGNHRTSAGPLAFLAAAMLHLRRRCYMNREERS
jgi:hypothetical protein